jgi:hypothetical protein
VSTVLGLLGAVVFVVCVIVFAAAVTGLVVRLTPSRKPASRQTDAA